METLLSFAATSFTKPSDLPAVEAAAAAVMLGWGMGMLALVRILGCPRASKIEEPAEYDEAA
jgi:hypothetical protein